MLVGDAARTDRADYSPLFGIILSWERSGVKPVFCSVFVKLCAEDIRVGGLVLLP